jgi:hypothetical protein
MNVLQNQLTKLNDGLVTIHSTTSILTSAHGQIDNSILSRYCFTTLIRESGPGVDTLTGSGKIHSMQSPLIRG